MKIPRAAIYLATIWALIIAVSPLRRVFMLQVLGASGATFSVLPSQAPPKNFCVEAAKKFPDDARVQVMGAENNGSTSFGTFNSFIAPLDTPRLLRDYDGLLKKFPGNAWLLARRARIAVAYFKPDRWGGDFSDPKGEENFKAGKPSRERDPNLKPNFSREELNRAIEFCKRGQKLEPKNAFWDWMLVNFLLMDWRDEEAWQALASGAHKTHYEAHELEDTQNAIAARELALGRALIADEKIGILVGGGSYGQYGRWRETARIIGWEGFKMRRRGVDVPALRVWGNLGRLMRTIRNQSPEYISGLVAIACEAIAWGNARWNPKMSVNDPRQPRIKGAPRTQMFVAFARRLQRPDLARLATTYQSSSMTYHKAVTTRQGNFISNLDVWKYSFALALWACGVLLLLMMCSAISILILMALLSRVRFFRKLLRRDENGEPLAARDLRAGALAWLGARGLMSTLLLALVVQLSLGMVWLNFEGIGGGFLTRPIAAIWRDVRNNGLLSALKDFLNSYTLMEWMPNAQSDVMRYVALLAPLALGVLYCWQRAVERQGKQNGETEFSFRQYFQQVLTGRAFEPMDWGAAGGKILDWFLEATFFASLVTLVCWSKFNGREDYTLVLAIIITAGILLFLISLKTGEVRWARLPRKRETARFAFRLFQASSGIFLVTASTLYFLLLVSSLSLRNHIEHRFDVMARYGEIRALRMR